MNTMLLHAPNPASGVGIRKYASGPIADSYSSRWGWAVGGSECRHPGQYDERNQYDSALVSKDTNEYMHPSVRIRHKLLNGEWKPEALTDFNWEPNGVESEHTSEWVYRKELKSGDRVVIPEWKFSTHQWGREGPNSVEQMWLPTAEAEEFQIKS